MENKNNTYEELVQLKESGEIGCLSVASRKWRMTIITGAWRTTST